MRWLATRLHGNGTETVVADELPVSGGTVQRALSGTGGAGGTIPVEVARLQGTRAAAEQAMLAVSGKTRIAYGTVTPPGDPDVLWLRGAERVPYGWGPDESVVLGRNLVTNPRGRDTDGTVVVVEGFEGDESPDPDLELVDGDLVAPAPVGWDTTGGSVVYYSASRDMIALRVTGEAQGELAFTDDVPPEGAATAVAVVEGTPGDEVAAFAGFLLTGETVTLTDTVQEVRATGNSIEWQSGFALVGNPEVGATVYFRMLATAGEYDGPYADGDSEGWEWDGGPHASSSTQYGNSWQRLTDPQLAAAAQIENERVLVPGITGLYCLTDHGVVLGGGILTEDSGREGPAYALDAHGHAGYPENMPYDGNRQWVQVDPAMLIRHAWDHVQTRPRHDLGVAVDDTTTPVRVGHPEEEVSFETGAGEQVDFTAGPVKWNYWSTHDLAREVDSLAAEAPIEYTMTHTWDRQANVPAHRLRLGYPRLGRRRHDISFTVGVNVIAEPQVTTALDVSRVLVVGAGEGSEARRGWATRSTQALGRTVVLTDKTLTSNSACVAAAQRHLDWLVGEDEVTTLTVRDHPNAPLATWNMGDDIRIQGSSTGWGGDLDMWVRVLSDDIDPEAGEATLTVTRAERTG